MEKQKNIVKETKEKCIICNAETEYKFSTPVSERKYYIQGAGQLCYKCYLRYLTKLKFEEII